MEKSIEDIWKDGFLKNDALVAPKINDLYNQKSIHIIDKFKRMFRINLIAIVAFSLVFLIVSFLLDIFITGVIFFVTLTIMVIFNKRLLNDLEKIDKAKSSYQYLLTFNQWIEKLVAVNKRFSKFMYPIIFLSIILGWWFKEVDHVILGERVVNAFLLPFPETYLINGIPLIGIAMLVLILGLLFYFGGKIYMWDLNLVYGRVLKKLKELIADIESLRS